MLENRPSILDKPIAKIISLDWERILLIALIAATILTRLWDLEYRAYNHDESIHSDWSWNLYTGRGYQHNPIYHGPLLYHVTALTFFFFGDNDTTGRLPNTLFGIVIVLLPFFFRKWLGKRGWLATAAMLLISPAVLYYSRFNRHDVYVELFVILMALAILKYLDERKQTWLVAAAAILAFSFTAMETTFIFVAIFAIFLCGHFTLEFLRRRFSWDPLLTGIVSALFGIPFFGFFLAYQSFASFRKRDEDDDDEWRDIPSFDLSVVLGTFSLPLITPAVIYALNMIWQRVSKTDFFPIAAFSDINTIISISQSQPDVMARVLSLTAIMILFSAFLGLRWNARTWAIGAALFWPIFVIFFTTVFTNGGGFFTGLLGSLGYWLSQQEVARGGQPWYYYLFVMLPMYEFLPVVVGISGIFWYLYRNRVVPLVGILLWMLWIIVYYLFIRPAIIAVSPAIGDQLVVVFVAILIPLIFFATLNPEDSESLFPTLIFTWVVGVLVIFSWAGEKMPWLTMHLTIPLAFASGWALDKLLDADWRELLNRGALWLALLVPLVLVLLVVLGISQPFQGVGLDQLGASAGFLVVLVLLVAVVVPALVFVGRRFGAQEGVRIIAVTGVVVMVGLTIRFAVMSVYWAPDVASETMIYAQGSHDNVIAMDEIEELSRRLCSQAGGAGKTIIPCDNGTIKVAYDDDSSWPFVWYLRNYRNAQYYGATPGASFDAVVVIVGPKNEEAVKPFLGNKYVRRQYKLIWWPIEGYKDLSWERVVNYVTEPQTRLDLWNTWFYHKYNESFSLWPYVHNFAFYVRKDVANLLWNYAGDVAIQPQADDEYAKKTLTLTAVRSIGAPGTGNGQFNYPRNIAFDSKGNMFVVDSDGARVEKFDSEGKFLLAWGSKSLDGTIGQAGTFNQPWGIAVDKSGNVYVADTWNHRIQKFDSNGKFLLMWGTNGDTKGIANQNPTQFYGPRSVVADGQGNVLVMDTGNKRVLKFDANGNPLAQFGGVGADTGKFQEPVGLAIDKDGNIFVADTWNLRIQKFDSSFNFITQWPVQAWDIQTVVNKPYLAVDPDGNVFASDPESSRILKFTNDGKLVSVFGVRGVDLASFNLPTGLAFDSQGNLYVADSGNNRILIFVKP